MFQPLNAIFNWHLIKIFTRAYYVLLRNDTKLFRLRPKTCYSNRKYEQIWNVHTICFPLNFVSFIVLVLILLNAKWFELNKFIFIHYPILGYNNSIVVVVVVVVLL